MSKIGLIGLSGKPYHIGHERMIQKACDECDIVYVLISLASRARKGEVSISGDVMRTIWKDYLFKTIPINAIPLFTNGISPDISIIKDFSISQLVWELSNSMTRALKNGTTTQEIIDKVGRKPKVETPIGIIWWLLNSLTIEARTPPVFTIYVGPDDTTLFPLDKIEKYVLNPESVTVQVVNPTRFNDVSGTKMREWLVAGNKLNFVLNLPAGLSIEQKDAIWTLLYEHCAHQMPLK